MFIFISHSSKNKKTTIRICEMLESNGYFCMMAPQCDISDERCEALLLILSNASNQSKQVLNEIEYAVSHCIPTLVYQIEEVKLKEPLKYFLTSNQWIVGKDADNYEKILEGIKNIEANSPDSPYNKRQMVNTGESVENEKPVKNKNGGRHQDGWFGDKRKRILQLIEFVMVVFICGIMIFHEKGEQVSLNLGDSLIFGTYLGEPIEWRVIRIEGNDTAILISESILTNKAFDAPESGEYNIDSDNNDYWSVRETDADRNLELQEYVRGSSRWATSDIRTWLNSDEENVTYEGIGPVSNALSDKKNGYINEAGFLSGFTDKEKAAIIPTRNITNGNALDKTPVESTDLVWLLSHDELSWLKEADVRLYVKPTSQAIEQDQTAYYNIFSLAYGVEEYYWWLREPEPDKSSVCYIVDNGYNTDLLHKMEAGVSGFGVRPVIKINTKKLLIKSAFH